METKQNKNKTLCQETSYHEICVVVTHYICMYSHCDEWEPLQVYPYIFIMCWVSDEALLLLAQFEDVISIPYIQDRFE